MAKYSTAGITLSRSENGVDYTQVTQVQSFEISGAAKEQIESTSLEDTARTYVDGLPGFGTANFTIAWDPALTPHQNLAADFAASNTSRYWKVTHPSSGTVGDMTFTGPVITFGKSAGPNALDTHSFSIQISGGVTIAVA